MVGHYALACFQDSMEEVKLPLYPEECKGCGACCMYVGVPPFDEVESVLLKEELREDLAKYGARPNGFPCVWLTTDYTCAHYEHRPKVCRDVEPGSRVCKNAVKIYRGGAFKKCQ